METTKISKKPFFAWLRERKAEPVYKGLDNDHYRCCPLARFAADRLPEPKPGVEYVVTGDQLQQFDTEADVMIDAVDLPPWAKSFVSVLDEECDDDTVIGDALPILRARGVRP